MSIGDLLGLCVVTKTLQEIANQTTSKRGCDFRSGHPESSSTSGLLATLVSLRYGALRMPGQGQLTLQISPTNFTEEAFFYTYIYLFIKRIDHSTNAMKSSVSDGMTISWHSRWSCVIEITQNIKITVIVINSSI